MPDSTTGFSSLIINLVIVKVYTLNGLNPIALAYYFHLSQSTTNMKLAQQVKKTVHVFLGNFVCPLPVCVRVVCIVREQVGLTLWENNLQVRTASSFKAYRNQICPFKHRRRLHVSNMWSVHTGMQWTMVYLFYNYLCAETSVFT